MNKVVRFLPIAAVLALLAAPLAAAAAPSPPGIQGPAGGEPTTGQAPAAGDHGDEEHSVWAGLFWPTVNFAILAGGLWWFFGELFTNYLQERHRSIRRELVEAANVKAAATAQLAEIDRKLEALPAEIAALRKRGGEEIAAEDQRIAAASAAERDRLLEQTRREIDVQLRLARRALVEHTANLAVQLAGQRLRQEIAPADQDHLVDRYLDQVQEPRRAEGSR